MFESRHSDYLKEAEKSHFQGQYLEGAIFLWDLDLCRVYVEFMLGLCRIHIGFLCSRHLTFSCSRILYVT